MKYLSDFIKYSIIFFVLFEICFLVAFISQFGFDISHIGDEIRIVNVLKLISATLVAIGCGIYFFSFIIFHNRNMSTAFFISVIFGLLAVKGVSGNYIIAHFLPSTLAWNVAVISICLVTSIVLLVVSIIAQFHQNLDYLQHFEQKPANDESTENSLFM